MDVEVIVVGGSFAGLSAAMQAARARRAVLVVDAGQRRNRFAAHSHGFLGQDGREPAAIIADARDQLLRYPTVTVVSGTVVGAGGEADRFTVETDTGEVHTARRLVIATGVTDTLPEIEGLRERWGRSVFMCPYCDGYELGGEPIAVLATGDMAMHHAMILPDWGPTTLLTNGAFTPDADQRARLEARGVRIETAAVQAVTGDRANVRLADGQELSFAGLFTAPRIAPASDLAARLGCRLSEVPLGRIVEIDKMQRTSVPGVYAAGDTANMAASLAFAVRDGAVAGAAAQQSLAFGVG